ncbi:MAG: Sip1-related alpha-galactosidase [Candidatus Sumerlaeota bacterium]|nr:Sip1-related alpha-galactosidase [Candidatus Sumerlaeota bacterium]
MKLSLATRAESAGVERLQAFRGTPDDEGILARYEVDVPAFQSACYYAAYQKYDVQQPNSHFWPEGANRIQPLKIENFQGLQKGGMFLLLQLADGSCTAILPMAGPRSVAYFHSDGDQLILNLATLGVDAVEGDFPLCAWAKAKDPYRASKAAWEIALRNSLVGQSARLRQEKRYPDVFRYLGWCSWEEFKAAIDEPMLNEAMSVLEKSDAPVRYALIDDGHLDHDKRRLKSFQPNAKFPNGWRPLMALKSEKLRWIGVWLNFNGYWEAVAVGNQLGALNEHLAPVAGGGLLPKRDFLSSTAFYDAMIGEARRNGFDFVKVDNQAKNLKLYTGAANAAESAALNAQALEQACARHMDGLINCMAHGPVCIFNTRVSAVSRCSEDYKVGDLRKARRHLHNSYANLLWMGWTLWGDHDMFHSNDPVSGRMMAISKAMSGGPVYLSDNPKDFVLENIRPLCFDNGELLRPLAPAAPLPESVFLDPFAEAKPFRAIAPLANGAAAIVAYNLTEPEQPVRGAIRPEDYQWAGGLMLPEPETWSLPAEGLLLYDWKRGHAEKLAKDYPFTLRGFDDLLALLCPITKGWAVIGRADKYLSPAAVEVTEVTENELIVRAKEGGPVTVWSAPGKIDAGEHRMRSDSGGLWTVLLPKGAKDTVVHFRHAR